MYRNSVHNSNNRKKENEAHEKYTNNSEYHCFLNTTALNEQRLF